MIIEIEIEIAMF